MNAPFGRAIHWIITVAALGLIAYQFVDGVITNLHILFADDQTQIFEQMRSQSLTSDSAGEILGCLEYVKNYYASGTKQVTGSRLDRIVERARENAIREITEILREQTEKEEKRAAETQRESLNAPLIRDDSAARPAQIEHADGTTE